MSTMEQLERQSSVMSDKIIVDHALSDDKEEEFDELLGNDDLLDDSEDSNIFQTDEGLG